MAKYLLDHGALMPRFDFLAFNSLVHKKRELLDLLLAQGMDPNASYMDTGRRFVDLYITGDFPGGVQALVEHGADVNTKSSEGGDTPLIFAARKGHVDLARLLLQKGADISAKDNAENDALFYAEKNGHVEIAEMLRLAAQGNRPTH